MPTTASCQHNEREPSPPCSATFSNTSTTIFEHHRLWDRRSIISFKMNVSRVSALAVTFIISLTTYHQEKYILCSITIISTILLMLFDFFRRLSIFGAWKIIITDNYVLWSTPKSHNYPVDDIFGKSFQCAISEIQSITVTKYFYPSKNYIDHNHINCSICVKNDRHYNLIAVGSGIDFGVFFMTLKGLGVPCTEVLLDIEDA